MTDKQKLVHQIILDTLRNGPLDYTEIAKQIHDKYPKFCDDSIICTHHQRPITQPEWKHQVWDAKQYLAKKGQIRFNLKTEKWQLP